VTTKGMTCAQTLAVLIEEPGHCDRETLLAARHHASRCPRCSVAYDRSDPEFGAAVNVGLWGQDCSPSLRIGLLVLSIVQLVIAIPWLVGHSLVPDAHVAVSHLTRDGALGFMIATLGLVSAWRPRYVYAMTVMGFVVVALQLVSGLTDHDAHMVTGRFEIVHLLVLVIFAGMCWMAVDVARRATPHAKTASPVLRPVRSSVRATSGSKH